MNKPKWIPKWVSIPLLVVIAFIVVLFFVGDNNFMHMYDYEKQINQLKAEIKANEDSAQIYEAKARELNTDRERLEKIAREKYGMKRTNEDVYVTDIP